MKYDKFINPENYGRIPVFVIFQKMIKAEVQESEEESLSLSDAVSEIKVR